MLHGLFFLLELRLSQNKPIASNTMSLKRYKIFSTCFDKKGRAISYGENSYKKSHPLMLELATKVLGNPEKIYLHSEIQALLRAGDKAVHSILVQRFTSDGRPANAKPCPICQEGLRLWGVKEVCYTSDSGEIVKEKL